MFASYVAVTVSTVDVPFFNVTVDVWALQLQLVPLQLKLVYPVAQLPLHVLLLTLVVQWLQLHWLQFAV